MADIAWLAGLLEGEGCFRVSRSDPRPGRGPVIGVVLKMTDRDVVERAARLMGGPLRGPVAPRGPLARKPGWEVSIHGAPAAAWMMTLYPLMGARRQSAIRRALQDWRAWGIHKRGPAPHVRCIRGHRKRRTAHGYYYCRECKRVGDAIRHRLERGARRGDARTLAMFA